MGRGGAGAVAGAAVAGLAGAETRVVLPVGVGSGGGGAFDAAAAEAATGAALVAAPGGGAPGASVGSLIVGADVGLGGRLMRTVSFLGWTLEASAGLGGRAPPGDVGIFSAIIFLASTK